MSTQVFARVPQPAASGPSLFRRLLAAMLAFGLVVGLIFPGFVGMFVDSDQVSTPLFRGLCVLAGLVVGLANFLLFDFVVSRHIRRIVAAMNHIQERMSSGNADAEACVDGCLLEVTSSDALGQIQVAFNEMTIAIARRIRIETQTRRLLSRLSRTVDVDAVSAELLSTMVEHCGAKAGVLYDTTAASDEPMAVTGFDSSEALAKASRDGYGPVKRAMETGEVLELSVEAEPLQPLTMTTPLGAFTPSAVTVVPVLVDKRPVAVAVLASTQTGLAGVRREVLDVLRSQAGPYLQNAMLHKKLSEMAAIDELTRVLNRRFGMRRLTEEHANTLRHGAPLSALLLDVDHFKRFNDTHGHDAGDEVLRTVGKTLETSVRAGDVACRYGGEEFLVIAPNTPVSGAATLDERLRRKIESASVRWKGQTLAVSVSIGVAGWPTVQAATPEEIVTKADEALYFAKKSGRNRVAMHQGDGITVCAGPGAAEPGSTAG